MVYSQTNRTSSISSITNQFNGGGNKKAGLVPTVGKDSASSLAITALSMTRLSMPLVSNIHQSAPMYSRFSYR